MPSIKTSNRDASTRNINRGRDRWEKRRIVQGAGESSGAALDAHEAAADPHPQYLTDAEGDAQYSQLGHTHDASIITYTPANNAHWGGSDPGDTDNALDYLADHRVAIYRLGAQWTNGGVALIAADANVVYVTASEAGTITKATLLTAGGTGSCVVDVWKDTYANYPPTVADTITAAAKPTITSAVKYESTTLTGWTTSVAAGDILAFKLDSTTVFTLVTIILEITP